MPDLDRLTESVLAVLREKLPPFLRSVLKHGAAAVARGTLGAAAGLVAGALIGAGYAWACAILLGTQGTVTLALFLALVPVDGLAGALLGWWVGARSGVRHAVRSSPLLEDAVRAVADRARGMSGEDVGALQSRLARARDEIVAATLGTIGAGPWFGTAAARLARGTFDTMLRPHDELLKLEIADPALAAGALLPKIRAMILAATDGWFRRPIRATLAAAVAANLLPWLVLSLVPVA